MAEFFRSVGILTLVLCAQVGVLGRDPGQRCPKLEVVGPSGVVLPGDQATFSINIPEVPALLYQWTVTAGLIESGQGSPVIFVRTSAEDDGVELRASVTITGLASDCLSTAEGSVLVQQGGHPPELDRYHGLALSEELAQLDTIIQKRREFKSEGALYFFLSRFPNDSEAQLEHRKEAIRNRLTDRWGIPSSEIVFVFVDREFSTVFLVPFRKTGERPPDAKDRTTAKTECPNIVVTGPAGIIFPGEVAFFTATISGRVPDGLKFKWTVTDGTIIEGEGATTLRVLTPRNEYRIDATLHVEGLNKGCPNTASDWAEFWEEPEPILLDEFSAEVSEIPKDALERAVKEHRKYPTSQIYIFEYLPASTSDISISEKIRRMKDYMARELAFDVSSVTIMTVESDVLMTKIYRIPPGAENPIP